MSKKRNYPEENIQKALEYVKGEKGSINEAAKIFGVPRSSIQFKLKNPNTKFKSGPDPILSKSEEDSLVHWIVNLAKRGFPRKKEDVKSCVQAFLNDNSRQNPFINNRPGECWFRAFIKRNPTITSRTSEGVTNASACVAEKDIRKWFTEINLYIQENNLNDIMNDPTRVFNADETSFNLCPKTGKVLAEKGSKNVYEIEKSSSKENITVMFAFNANGDTVNPLIVYPYKRIPERVCERLPPDWGVARSDKGWMTAQVFYEYIANVFHPQLVKEGIGTPVVLFVDGHKTHLTMEVTKLCQDLDIHLIALYPNATRILQPADVSAFKPIKTAWQSALRAWHIKHNYQVTLTKLTFGPLLEDVLKGCITKKSLVNGFRATGLHPFNADNVDYSKCLSRNDESLQQNTGLEKGKVPSEVKWKMDYYTFKDIVGEENIRSFEENIVASENVVYQLWKKFIENRITEDENLLDPVTGLFGNKNDAFEQNNLHLKSQAQETTSSFPTTSGRIITMLPTQTREEHSQLTTSPRRDIPPLPMPPRQEISPVPTPSRKNTALDSKEEITCTVREYTSPEPCTSKNDRQMGITSKQTNPNKAINILSDETLSEYLARKCWSETPKRKGKRETVRMPFAITSHAYMNIMSSKKEKKQKIEQDKENRKRKREEERKLKNELGDKRKNKGKGKRSKTADISEISRQGDSNCPMEEFALLTCNVCNGNIRKLGLLCSECGKISTIPAYLQSTESTFPMK